MPPLAATVIGGYLGAGKTTLVNHLLRHANGLRLAVLVNEFGALPIDEDLIEAEGDDVIAIAGGCICCSFGSDLTAALIDISAMNPRPDHVVIEASGVAMPGAIAANIGLLDAYAPATVAVLADSETVQTQAQDEYLGDTTVRQLVEAHLIIQTKTDLVGDAQVSVVDNWLAEINPRAARLAVAQGQLPVALVLGHTADHAPSESFAHSDALFASDVFAARQPCDPAQLAQALASRCGVVRSKGFVRGLDGRTHLIQTVGARATATPYRGEAEHRIVCIGLRDRFDCAGLTALFASPEVACETVVA